jgi:hypothetical protein
MKRSREPDSTEEEHSRKTKKHKHHKKDKKKKTNKKHKEKKAKKEHKEKNSRAEECEADAATGGPAPVSQAPVERAALTSTGAPAPPIRAVPAAAAPRRAPMVPMSFEDYQKQQAVVREVLDPETGRVRWDRLRIL